MSSGSSSQFLRAGSSTSNLPHPARCPSCSFRGDPDKTTRNLVVCIDGTANKFGRNNTNVVKLFEAVDCDTRGPLPEQYTYYSSGIGTRPRILDVFHRIQRAISDKLDMAIAWNVEEIVKEAYAWLASKYQEGDQIYLFGFSRGAYQVRILAGMIYEVGLIKNPTEKQIGTAYDHFESILFHKPNANDMAREFRMTFSWKDTKVHFIGVWDTVSSVGLGRGEVCLSASSAAAHACHIRHALALDECRVKFIPEYFLEMNSPDLHKPTQGTEPESRRMDVTNEETPARENGLEATIDHSNARTSEGSWSASNDDTILEDRDVSAMEKTHSALTHSIPHTYASSDEYADPRTSNIKEVWFAGTHSDVGGTHRPGKTFHAGNVPLMWMRREVSRNGLVLKPGHSLWTLWTDEDIDLGTIDSMTFLWKLVEFLPIRHEVSFSGSGENDRRIHLFEPRRILPGQKIHASVQYANTYIPKATFGNGFGNPLETAGPMPSKEDDIWERGAVDYATYVALFDYLTGRQGIAPYYLHKLLFMLRFTEGRSPIKEMPDWQRALADLITKQSGLVRLVALAAYFEAIDSPDIEKTFQNEVFVEARQSLISFIKPDQPDWPRAVALLRPLAKHKYLRTSILSPTVIDSFLQLLDYIIDTQGEHFAHVMDALSSLVELHPDSIVIELIEPSDGTKSRLSSMLNTEDPRHLTAVLRVVIFLAERAPLQCHLVEPRLHELARKRKGPVSLLAVQALVEMLRIKLIQDPGLGLVEPLPPSMHRSPTLRSSTLLGTVQYLHAGTTNNTPAGEWMRIGDSLLYKIFSTKSLGDNRREFINKLLDAAGGRHTSARTAATFTLLKLCNFDLHLRTYISRQGFLDILVKQLQFEDSALLAAYAITRCLPHEIFLTQITRNPLLAGRIINMMILDHFDEAIGVTEGFSILEDLLKCDELKRQILGYDITTLLECKLGSRKPGEMRASLIYLNIFRIYDDNSLIRGLVGRGMFHLRTKQWRSQKVGVAILCSLAQSWFGVEALKQVIPEVVNMILPTHESNFQQDVNAPHTYSQSKSPSSLLGPAFVLRVLANNETLREEIRQTAEYGRLKHLFLFGDLLGSSQTPIWQVWTPTRDDVLNVINQMIKSMDSVEGSTNGFILPDVQHWDRIARLLRNGVVWAIVVPSVLAGVAVLVAIGSVAVAPVVISRKVAELMGRSWRLRRQNAIIRNLKFPDSEPPNTGTDRSNV